MTQSTDRLDRIEALLERSLVQHNQEMAEIRAGLRETRAVTESNARAIEAWGDRIEEGIAEAEEVSSQMVVSSSLRLEEAIATTVQLVANLGQQQQETDQRFNTLLEEGRADRAEMRAARDQWQLEAQANSAEHRAFTQNIQILLAEIARLWQRVAG